MKPKTFAFISVFLLTGITMLLILRETRKPQTLVQEAAGSCTVSVSASVTTIDGTGNYANIKPGDTICLAAGTRPNLRVVNLHGTATAPITVINSGGKVTVTGSQLGAGFSIDQTSYVRFTGTGVSSQCGAQYPQSAQNCGIEMNGTLKGWEVEGSTGNTGNIEADHIAIINTRGGFSSGVSVKPRGPKWTGFKLHHMYLSNTGNEGFYLGNATGSGAQLANVDVSYNLIIASGFDGINLKYADTGNAIHHNVLINTGTLTGSVNHVPEGGIKLASAASDIYNNLILDSHDTGIAEGGTPRNLNNKYYNNIVVRAKADAILTKSTNISVYNNTVVSSPVGYKIGNGGKAYDNIAADSGSLGGTNNWTGSVSTANFVNPSGDDYHLRLGSPAIDSAAGPSPAFDYDNKPRPQGRTSDRGAYEFGINVPTVVPSGNITIPPTERPTSPPTTGPTLTAQPGTTQLGLTLLLHGIGKGGDNVNPIAAGTLIPGHPQRQVEIELFDANSQPLGVTQGTVTFNASAGNFQGTIDAGTINNGVYTGRVKVLQYLGKSYPGILNLTGGQTNQLPPLALTTGDTFNDNRLSILDYNLILDCYADLSLPRNCDTNKKLMTDLTDDSFVNQFDYNLFLRELSVQSGQ